MTIYICEREESHNTAQLVKILHFWQKWTTWQYHKLVDINTYYYAVSMLHMLKSTV